MAAVIKTPPPSSPPPSYTIVKSTVICWILIFSFAFKLEKPNRHLVLVIVLITGGLILFRAKEGLTFHSLGFFMVR